MHLKIAININYKLTLRILFIRIQNVVKTINNMQKPPLKGARRRKIEKQSRRRKKSETFINKNS